MIGSDEAVRQLFDSELAADLRTVDEVHEAESCFTLDNFDTCQSNFSDDPVSAAVSQDQVYLPCLIDLSISTSTYLSTPATSQNSIFPTSLELIESENPCQRDVSELFDPVPKGEFIDLNALDSIFEFRPEPAACFLPAVVDEVDTTFEAADESSDAEGPDHGLCDSTDEEDVPLRSTRLLSHKQRSRREHRLWLQKYNAAPEPEPDFQDLIDLCAPELATGNMPFDVDEPHYEPEVCAASTRRSQWKSRKSRSKLNFASGEFEPCVSEPKSVKDFENLTIGELRRGYSKVTEAGTPLAKCWFDVENGVPPNIKEDLESENVNDGYDDGSVHLWEEEEDKPAEVLGFSWRSEPETYENRKWVKVKSVVDSGASAPVAPPSMLPNVPVRPSEGSKRGQKYTSASKHKIKNLGEQHCRAFTENGEPTEVLFQVADVSKPLVSVSAICENGNRVIFGRSGGVVQNLRTGNQIPFRRENGIYILSMWLLDGNDEGFGRP